MVLRIKGPGLDVSVHESLDPAAAAALLRTISHPTRLRLLAALNKGECHVGFLVKRLGLPQPVVSRELARLRFAGLVADRRLGVHVRYRLAGNAVAAGSAPPEATLAVGCSDVAAAVPRGG